MSTHNYLSFLIVAATTLLSIPGQASNLDSVCYSPDKYSLEVDISDQLSARDILNKFPGSAGGVINGTYNGSNTFEGIYYSYGALNVGEKSNDTDIDRFLTINPKNVSDIIDGTNAGELMRSIFSLGTKESRVLIDDGKIATTSTSAAEFVRSAIAVKEDSSVCFVTSRDVVTSVQFAQDLENLNMHDAVFLSGAMQVDLAYRNRDRSIFENDNSQGKIKSFMHLYTVEKERIALNTVSSDIRNKEERKFIQLSLNSPDKAFANAFNYPLDGILPKDWAPVPSDKRKPKEIIIASHFGTRRIYNNTSARHTGVDLFLHDPGMIPAVISPGVGKVVFVGFLELHGNTVAIDHGNKKVSVFAHLASPSTLSVGDMVQPKQVLGSMGDSGKAEKAHLHWALISRGKFVDPLKHLGLLN